MKALTLTRTDRQSLVQRADAPLSGVQPPQQAGRGQSGRRLGFALCKMLIVMGLVLASTGCEVWVESPVEPVVVEPQEPPQVYVDTYLDVPAPVLDLIAPFVQGYFTPALSRYDEYLYPHDTPYDRYDLPGYVRSDFNGDGYDDYAFLFSAEEWGNDAWLLTTKLVVVLTSHNGLVLSTNQILGSVSGVRGVPVEEYWSLLLMPAGEHSISVYHDGVEVVKSVTLYDDGFYLASLDPEEEALFYAEGAAVYETDWLSSGLGKKAVTAVQTETQKRIIPFHKNVEGRKLPN